MHCLSSRSPWQWLGALLSVAAFAAAAEPASPPRALDYARAPALSGFSVSPSNRHAAFLMRGEKGRQVAVVIELDKPASRRIVASYADANVTRVSWINERRLVYEASQPGAVIERSGAGTFAVDIDGTRQRQLINWFEDNETLSSRLRAGVLKHGWQVWRSWDGRSDDVLAYRDLPAGLNDFGSRLLVRMNSATGAMVNPSYDQPLFARHWTFDAEGQLRLIGTRRDGREKLFLRAKDQDTWQEIENHPEFSDQPLQPLYIEGDGTVIVLSRRGRDTYALHTYDPRTRTLGAEPLAAARDFDIDGSIESDGQARQVVGVHLQADRERSIWFDPGLAAAQQAVDAALPSGRQNRLMCGNCLGAQHFIVRSSSDRVSGEYFIYDRQQRRLTPLGAERPWLPEATQGRRSFHRVAARDGLSLPVVVTHPPGRDAERNLPAVMLVHGGPWVRGTDLAWSGEAQFLASRGYRVLEVDFRGSSGLGWKHFRAGWKQWGLAMQDDLADVVAWAVREGSVDARRVCITGSSYGGYAALMGPVRHPGTYRCVASHVGVTDLSLMFSGSSTDVAVQYRRFSYPMTIGDPKVDGEMLRQNSPVHRVAEMKVPILVAQGGLDRRVTKTHADRFEAAARAAGVEIERVDYPDDGHGWFDINSEVDYMQRLERLLARTLALPP